MNPYFRQQQPQQYRRGMGETPAAAPPPAPPIPDELMIPVDVTLAASAFSRDVGIDIDKDAAFVLTHLWGTSTGLYSILLRQFNGRGLSTSAVRSDNLVGTVKFKTPLRPQLYPPGSRISMDLENLTAADNAVQLVLGGYRLPNR